MTIPNEQSNNLNMECGKSKSKDDSIRSMSHTTRFSLFKRFAFFNRFAPFNRSAPFNKPNRLLLLFGLLLISLFLSLGYWQLTRMDTKKLWQENLTVRNQVPLLLENLKIDDLKSGVLDSESDALGPDDLLKKINLFRFQLLKVSGVFLNNWHLLLDNQLFLGQAGYRVFTPLLTQDKKIILIDRGWIPLKPNRDDLPYIAPIFGEITLSGLINQPNQGLLLKDEYTHQGNVIRLQNIHYQKLAEQFKTKQINGELLPFVLQLAAENPLAYHVPPINFQPQIKKHLGYAVQWFTMALVVFIYGLVMIRRRDAKKCDMKSEK